jgi:GntR family transcriptional regulator
MKVINLKKNPLYEDISILLESMINSTEYKIGDKIPGDIQLMNKFKVSRETIRRAINILVEEGYVVRRPGKGTFISKKDGINDSIGEKISFTKEIIKMGYVPKNKIISFNKVKNNKKLFQNEEYLYRIIKIRYASEIPFAYEESYLPFSKVGDIDEDMIKDSMHYFLSKKKNFIYKKMEQEIKPVLIDSPISEYLNTKRIPGIKLSRKIFDEKNDIFLYLKFIFRGDIYTFKSVVKF